MNYVQKGDQIGLEHRPGAAAQATISRAAQAGLLPVCRSITVSVSAAGTASGIITFVLRDSTTGAGNVLWSAKLQAPINTSQQLCVPDLAIRGVRGQAMTLESTGAGAAASELTVAMSITHDQE